MLTGRVCEKTHLALRTVYFNKEKFVAKKLIAFL
jgi:hypothetical protein